MNAMHAPRLINIDQNNIAILIKVFLIISIGQTERMYISVQRKLKANRNVFRVFNKLFARDKSIVLSRIKD